MSSVNWQVVLTSISVAFAVGFFIWKASGWYHGVNSTTKTTNDKLDHLTETTNEKFATLTRTTNEKFAILTRTTDEKFAILIRTTNERFDKLTESTNARFATLTRTTNERFATLTESTNERFARLTESTNARFATLTESVSALSGVVETLQKVVSQAIGKPIAGSSSPLLLNDYGKTLSQAVDAPSLAERYTKGLETKIATMNPYQIQELCFDFADTSILGDLEKNDKENFDKVTACAYKEGIKADKIMRVIGILMRDMLLNQAGHAPTTVDDHAPGEP